MAVNAMFAITTLTVILYSITASQLAQLWPQYVHAKEEVSKAKAALLKTIDFEPFILLRLEGEAFAVTDLGVMAVVTTEPESLGLRKVQGIETNKMFVFPPGLSVEPWPLPRFPWKKLAAHLQKLMESQSPVVGTHSPLIGYASTLTFQLRLIRQAQVLRRNRTWTLLTMLLVGLISVATTFILTLHEGGI